LAKSTLTSTPGKSLRWWGWNEIRIIVALSLTGDPVAITSADRHLHVTDCIIVKSFQLVPVMCIQG
jgi:hypothetical protein